MIPVYLEVAGPTSSSSIGCIVGHAAPAQALSAATRSVPGASVPARNAPPGIIAVSGPSDIRLATNNDAPNTNTITATAIAIYRSQGRFFFVSVLGLSAICSVPFAKTLRGSYRKQPPVARQSFERTRAAIFERNA